MSGEVKCPRCGADIIADYERMIGYCPYCKHQVWLEFDGIDNVLVAKEFTKQEQEKTKREQEKTRRRALRYTFLGQGCKRAMIFYFVLLFISLGILGAMYGFDAVGNMYHSIKGDLHPPMSSETIEDGSHYYKDVVEEFESAGFTNIKVRKEDDLVIGFLAKNKSVKSISIDGQTYFTRDDWMKKDALVRIIYHVKN